MEQQIHLKVAKTATDSIKSCQDHSVARKVGITFSDTFLFLLPIYAQH